MNRIQIHRASPDESRWWLWGGTLAVGTCFVAGNVALYPLFREETMAAIVYAAAWAGVALAQASLAAIWLSLGRPAAPVRVAFTAGTILILVTSYLAGFLWRESYDDRTSSLKQQLSVVLLIPFLVAASAVSLWILRVFFGWHIRHKTAPPAVYSRQYSIGSLLTLTTLVALLLAACQQAQHLMRTGPLEFWLGIAGWFLAILIVSSLTLIPAAISLSYPRTGLGVLIGVATGIYIVVVLLLLWILYSFGGKLQRGELFGSLGFVGCFLFDFVLTLAVSLFAVRSCGYRLVMGGNMEPKE